MLGNDKKQEKREGERHREILKQRNDSYLPSPCITHKPTAVIPGAEHRAKAAIRHWDGLEVVEGNGVWRKDSGS